jgi:transcriptional regulator with XRE-family HTH domain
MNLRITEHCKSQGITLQDLADKIGVARSTLANTLSKGNPTVETLSKIADALGVEITDLFEKSSSDEVIGVVRIGDNTHVINSKEDIKKLADNL